MSRSILRSVALFVFICIFGVSLASAAPTRGENRSAPERGGIVKLFRVLPELWTSITTVFLKEGSSLDPDGKPTSSASTDTGSSLDPNGHQ